MYTGFVRVLSELVGDATERLVYRAQLYAEADILRYNPASGDLAYPEKLQMMQVSVVVLFHRGLFRMCCSTGNRQVDRGIGQSSGFNLERGFEHESRSGCGIGSFVWTSYK